MRALYPRRGVYHLDGLANTMKAQAGPHGRNECNWLVEIAWLKSNHSMMYYSIAPPARTLALCINGYNSSRNHHPLLAKQDLPA